MQTTTEAAKPHAVNMNDLATEMKVRPITSSAAGIPETKIFRFREQDNAVQFVMDVWDLVDRVEVEGAQYYVHVLKRKIS